MSSDASILFLDYAGHFNANFNADGQRNYVRYGTRPVRHHDQVYQCFDTCFCDTLLTYTVILHVINYCLLMLMVWRHSVQVTPLRTRRILASFH